MNNKMNNQMLRINKLRTKIIGLSLAILVISLGVHAEAERKYREYQKSDEPTVDVIRTSLTNNTKASNQIGSSGRRPC